MLNCFHLQTGCSEEVGELVATQCHEVSERSCYNLRNLLETHHACE